MKDIKQRSRGALRLQMARGTDEEAMLAFEELMRRNMEEQEEPLIRYRWRKRE